MSNKLLYLASLSGIIYQFNGVIFAQWFRLVVWCSAVSAVLLSSLPQRSHSSLAQQFHVTVPVRSYNKKLHSEISLHGLTGWSLSTVVSASSITQHSHRSCCTQQSYSAVLLSIATQQSHSVVSLAV